MSFTEKAKAIVNMMFERDNFSKWLNIEILEIQRGESKLKMKVREEMLNGFAVAHGSITYALADSALAFASNSHGKKSLSIDTQISHLRPCFEGDVLIANAREINRSRKLGQYDIEIHNQKNELVAHFRGTVYIKSEDWELDQ